MPPEPVSGGGGEGQPLIAGLHPKGVDQARNIAQQGQNDIENKRPAEAFSQQHTQRRQR